jgi:hypothetical protein
MQVLSWALALLLPIALAWCAAVFWMLKEIKRSSDELIKQHQDADNHGFGTVKITKSIDDLEQVMESMLHYVVWAVEQMTGKKPPPPKPRPL